MIERLNQISLNDFIELSCGNYDCLNSDGELNSQEVLKERASKLIVDYRSIVNPSGMQALLLDKEELMKMNAKVLSLRICQSLISINSIDDVREVLLLFEVDAQKMSDEEIISKVNYMLHSVIFELKRNKERHQEEGEGGKATEEQIRSSFDTEIAFLMTYFKMNIDPRLINASVYANIVHQADVEIKMKRNSM